MANGGWIFISHSHQDIALVRRIRNHFEKLGFEPLLFYLKCLSDESEIDTLIKREIDEREWFVYADSPNARASKWVRTEREHIERSEGTKIFVIDLEADLEQQLRAIEHIARQMKVFISYSRRDLPLYRRLRAKLEEKDMQVLSDESLSDGTSWVDAASAQISAACRDGFVLLLVTESSCRSQAVADEIRRAQSEGGRIVPVYVGQGTLHPDLLMPLGDVQGVSIGEMPSDAELDRVVEDILRRVEYYESDFTSSYGFRRAATIHLPPISRIDAMTFFDCEALTCVYVPSSVVYIAPDTFEDHPDILIKCERGSYCEGFCRRHGLRFELVEM